VVRSWQRALLGTLLLAAVAAAGIALNFGLLRLTQESNDPVGKLSPRAVFSEQTSPATTTGRDDTPATVPSQVPPPTHGGDGDGDD